MKVALLSGTSITSSAFFNDWPIESRDTEFGPVAYRGKGRLVVLNRHGREGKTPPHAINHRANIAAIKSLGCAHIISLNSVGSLRQELPPGTMISCGDYVSFAPISFSDTIGHYLAPQVKNGLLAEIEEILGQKLPRDKVYVQTRGPRFETPAEVRIVQPWGDVVGMTMASEADLANEVGLDYTSLGMIDNFANGLGEEKLTLELFRARLKQNQEKVDFLLEKIVERWG